MGQVFDDFERTDGAPCRFDEGRFDFLNRSASRYFSYIRRYIEEWVAHLPEDAVSGIVGPLRSGDRQHEAAFWELYLHEAYGRSGFNITIHPTIANSPNHPDFMLERGGARFYLEAVSVGHPPGAIAEDKRLGVVHRVLAELELTDFMVGIRSHAVGKRPLATRPLRSALKSWTASLDADEVISAVARGGSASIPLLPWEDDGWRLVFEAIPVRPDVRGRPRRALGSMTLGDAVLVDNEPGVARVLKSKASRYGALDAPLVVAVQSNT